jgi:hypothetical protein
VTPSSAHITHDLSSRIAPTSVAMGWMHEDASRADGHSLVLFWLTAPRLGLPRRASQHTSRVPYLKRVAKLSHPLAKRTLGVLNADDFKTPSLTDAGPRLLWDMC